MKDKLAKLTTMKIGPVRVIWVIGLLAGLLMWWAVTSPSTVAPDDVAAADTETDEPEAVYPDGDSGSGVGGGFSGGLIIDQPDLSELPADDLPEPSIPEPAPTTNEEWKTRAVQYLTGIGLNEVYATTTIGKYLTGTTLTPEEDATVKKAVAKLGPTPVAVPAPKSAPVTPVAAKQGTPPTTHTILGMVDDDPTELSVIYYGTAAGRDAIIAANPGRTSWLAGQSVKIPAWSKPAAATPVTPTPAPVSTTKQLTINENETIQSFIGRARLVHGVTPSLTSLKALNPDRLLTIEKAAEGKPHASSRLTLVG